MSYEFGRNVNALNIFGETPLIEALKNLDKDDPSIFMLFLHPNIDLDRKIRYAHFGTALHYGVYTQSIDADKIKMLIDNGADVNAKDKNGNTALHLAIKMNSREIIRVLTDNGADVDEKALRWASMNNCYIVKTLLYERARLQHVKKLSRDVPA